MTSADICRDYCRFSALEDDLESICRGCPVRKMPFRMADEDSLACLANKNERMFDRREFVKNIGWLLSQTKFNPDEFDLAVRDGVSFVFFEFEGDRVEIEIDEKIDYLDILSDVLRIFVIEVKDGLS